MSKPFPFPIENGMLVTDLTLTLQAMFHRILELEDRIEELESISRPEDPAP